MPVPEQRGDRSVSIGGNNWGPVITGDNVVIWQIDGEVSAKFALAELAELTQRVGREIPFGQNLVDEQLTEKANGLAKVVRARLQREVERLRLQDRASLSVHWRPAFGNALGDEEDSRNAPSGAVGDSLQSLAEMTANSRWLMMLGREGSGKSVLALQFALNRLEARSSDGAGPVPVIFSLGSYRPGGGADALHRWLIDRLERDYPFLAAVNQYGMTWAEDLVAEERVLPILDGFDEIIADLHTAALQELNSSVLPLVVTSRHDAIETVRKKTEGDVVPSAAVIELVDLGLDAAVEYLHKSTGAPGEGKGATGELGWKHVLDELTRRSPNRARANLAAALSTPLMTTLARFAYESDDPSNLLKTEKFETRDALEKHLLDYFIRTAYERRLKGQFAKRAGAAGAGATDQSWDAERAMHWLGYLAVHLTKHSTPDIEWWKLGTPPKSGASPRLAWVMLQIGVTVGMASGLVAGLVYGVESALVYGPAFGLVAAGLTGPANGTAVGLAFGLMHGFVTKMKVAGPTFEPSRMKLTLHGPPGRGARTGLRKSFRPRVMGGLAGGLLFGLLWALGSSAFSALLGTPWPMIGRLAGVLFVEGTGLGLLLGLLAALGARFERVIGREELIVPSLLLDTSRATVLKQITAAGLVIWAGYGTTFGVLSHNAPAGLAAGLVAGCMVALGIGTMTAWGRWVVLAQIWLPLARRLPRELNTFLEDSYERGVLRRHGAVYQFRHARLKEHLALRYHEATCGHADQKPEKCRCGFKPVDEDAPGDGDVCAEEPTAVGVGHD
ncbi:NACHT domain-containing protein [Streptomyces sp. NPDC059639]|uniref:NACHT domain-containing protein n=1 Tax=Streptomyces sp. NPDC059639 TaxID=3346891 RepID=UPI0036CDCDE8